MLTVRKIEMQDKDAIIHISSKIWEGDDYISKIFDKWVNDPQGEFAAVLYEGKIVGFGRLVYHTPTDVWMEGLRKDPDVDIKGIGKTLSEYYLKRLQGKKLTSVRFSTYFENVASISIAEKLGFREALRMSIRCFVFEDHEDEMKGLPESAYDVSKLQPEVNTEELYRYLEDSSFLRKTRNYFCIGWVCHTYSREVVEKLIISSKQYLITFQNGKITGLLLYDLLHATNAYNVCNISFFSADDAETAAELLFALKVLTAKKEGITGIEIKAPTDAETLLKYLQEAGFEGWDRDDDFIIFEYPLNNI